MSWPPCSESADLGQWHACCCWVPIDLLKTKDHIQVRQFILLTDSRFREFNWFSRREICELPHELICLAGLREVLVYDRTLNVELIFLQPSVIVLPLHHQQLSYLLPVLAHAELHSYRQLLSIIPLDSNWTTTIAGNSLDLVIDGFIFLALFLLLLFVRVLKVHSSWSFDFCGFDVASLW